MKKFYSLIVLLLLCVSAAQAKYTYWGYGDKTISSVNGAATAGKAAIYIPAELAKCYVGKTVTGVRFGLAANVQSLSVLSLPTLTALLLPLRKLMSLFQDLTVL